MIVEFIGVPGTGKTALCKALLRRKRCGGHYRYVHPYRFPAASKHEPTVKFIGKIIGAERLSASRILSAMLFRPPTNEERLEALWAVAPRWREFLRFAVQDLGGDAAAPALQLMARKWFVETLAWRAWAELRDTPATIMLMDEPLSFRLSYLPRSDECVAWINRYYELMPLPGGVISLVADEKTVLARLDGRTASSGAVNFRHRGLSPQELKNDLAWAGQIATCAVAALSRRGVSVLSLNAGDSLAANSERIDRHICEMIRAGQPGQRDR